MGASTSAKMSSGRYGWPASRRAARATWSSDRPAKKAAATSAATAARRSFFTFGLTCDLPSSSRPQPRPRIHRAALLAELEVQVGSLERPGVPDRAEERTPPALLPHSPP